MFVKHDILTVIFFLFFFFIVDDANKLLKSYEKFFEDDEKFNRVDESKRINMKQFNSSNCGLDGSFKKIELD